MVYAVFDLYALPNALLRSGVSGLCPISCHAADWEKNLHAAHLSCNTCVVWLYMTQLAAHVRRPGVCNSAMHVGLT
jgi:hypothetical protein